MLVKIIFQSEQERQAIKQMRKDEKKQLRKDPFGKVEERYLLYGSW